LWHAVEPVKTTIVECRNFVCRSPSCRQQCKTDCGLRRWKTFAVGGDILCRWMRPFGDGDQMQAVWKLCPLAAGGLKVKSMLLIH
jgi:hypothetical protein